MSRNERSCLSVSGRLSALTADTPSGVGEEPCLEIVKPRNFTELLTNWHFFSFILRPALRSVCRVSLRMGRWVSG